MLRVLKRGLRRTLQRLGYDVIALGQPSPRSSALVRQLALHQVGCVLDVGANTGQFGLDLRRAGFRGRIISFEPMKQPFSELQRRALQDPNWDCRNTALGSVASNLDIHVSRNSVSSSILPLEARTLHAEPSVEVIGKEAISVEALDDVFRELVSTNTPCFLKLDVQGYEREVLKGASQVLPQLAGLVLESSLVPLYQGEWLLPDALIEMDKIGYRLAGLEPEFTDPNSGELLQVNALFWNRSLWP